jgi:hypothetical protein
MTVVNKALEANLTYAKNYDPTLGKRPAPKIAVVTPCIHCFPTSLGAAPFSM